MGTENKASSTLRALASTADTPPPPKPHGAVLPRLVACLPARLDDGRLLRSVDAPYGGRAVRAVHALCADDQGGRLGGRQDVHRLGRPPRDHEGRTQGRGGPRRAVPERRPLGGERGGRGEPGREVAPRGAPLQLRLAPPAYARER